MPRIFVFHPDPAKLAGITAQLDAYYRKSGREKHLTTFLDAAQACAWLRGKAVRQDILFLAGTDLSTLRRLTALLRKSNLRASWVYMDGTIEGLQSILLYRPSAYVPDSTNTEQLHTAIAKLDRYHCSQVKQLCFSFRFEGDTIHIPFERINYIESCAKKVILHLTDHSQSYFFSAKLDDIQKKLPDTFIRCHQSYLVNPQHISRLDSRDHRFILNDGSDVLISRRMYTAAKACYEQYLDDSSLGLMDISSGFTHG